MVEGSSIVTLNCCCARRVEPEKIALQKKSNVRVVFLINSDDGGFKIHIHPCKHKQPMQLIMCLRVPH
jgi:hypothetical protein